MLKNILHQIFQLGVWDNLKYFAIYIRGKIWIICTHIKNDFRRLQRRYKNNDTDWSKEDSKVGCAVISGNHSYMQRILDDSSIFTAEAKAVDLA